MLTLCIRYTIDPNKLNDFKAYAEAEQEPIHRGGGNNSQYFLPTDFAGATNHALGLIELPSLAAYEKYRGVLDADPDHRRNVARLQQSGAVLAMERSFIRRL